MLHDIRKRPEGGDRPETVLGRLTQCHARIREMLATAERLSKADPTSDERAEVAERVRRYFSQAFTQHVIDEDEIIGPRLGAAAADVLARLHEEHVRDQPDIDELVRACDEIAAGYDAGSLGDIVARVTPRVLAHLSFEEAEFFPSIEALPESEQRAIFDEMGARRAARKGRGPT